MSDKILVEDIKNISTMVNSFVEKLKADHWKTIGYIKDADKVKSYVKKSQEKEELAKGLLKRIELFFESQFDKNKTAPIFSVADRILLIDLFSKHQKGLSEITENLIGEDCHFDVMDEIREEMKNNADSLLKTQMLIFSDI